MATGVSVQGRGFWGDEDSSVIYPHDDPTGLQSTPSGGMRPRAPPEGMIDRGEKPDENAATMAPLLCRMAVMNSRRCSQYASRTPRLLLFPPSKRDHRFRFTGRSSRRTTGPVRSRPRVDRRNRRQERHKRDTDPGHRCVNAEILPGRRSLKPLFRIR